MLSVNPYFLSWGNLRINKRSFIFSLLVILLLIVAGAGWFSKDYLGKIARQEIIGESRASVLTLSIYLSSTFTHIEGAVKALAGSPWITPALIFKRNQDIEHADSVLDRYNSALNASVSYLMDVDGLTVASSNRKDPDSFVGKSYRFRPYFQEAAKGQGSRYFALGVTSGKRGFYASYPVQSRQGKVLGVVTMKKDLDKLETFFSNYPFCFLINRDGVIFLSSTPEMVMKSLWPLDKAIQEKLIASKQFGDKPFQAVINQEIGDGSEVNLKGNDYFVSRRVIGSDGWSIVLLTPSGRVWIYKLIGILATIIVCSSIMVFMGLLYLTNRSLEAIRQSEESKHLLLHGAGDGIFGVDVRGQTTFVNPAALRMLGFAEEEMLGRSVHALIHHSHKDGSNYPVEDCPMYASYTKATEHRVTEEVLWRKNGGSFPVEYFSTPIIRDGKVMGAVVVFEDITERKQAEEALFQSEARYRAVAQSANDAIITADREGMIVNWNQGAEKIFGYLEAEIIGQSVIRLMPDRFHDRHLAGIKRLQSGGDRRVVGKTVELEGLRKDGSEFPLELSLAIWETAEGRFYTGILRDITERKHYQENMEYFALHDALTGLLNRHSLEEQLNRTIARAKRGRVSSLIYMDLDNFKEVNDTVGHGAGDEVLITLTNLIKAELRIEDIVFRLGGDEFAVLLEGMESHEALSAAERLRLAVESHPFELRGRIFPSSLSIGLILIEGTLTAGELLSQADTAMYQAKTQGKNRVAFFNLK
jgi:diguanylate cyclase (GGDEF)-like protein/PAS domain S-box-containing protein